MNRTKIVIELEFEESFDVMKLRKSIEKLLVEEQINGYSIEEIDYEANFEINYDIKKDSKNKLSDY